MLFPSSLLLNEKYKILLNHGFFLTRNFKIIWYILVGSSELTSNFSNADVGKRSPHFRFTNLKLGCRRFCGT